MSNLLLVGLLFFVSPLLNQPGIPSVVLYNAQHQVTAVWGEAQICKEFSSMGAILLRNYAILHVSEKQQVTFLLTRSFKKDPMLEGFAPGLFRILNRIYSFAPKFAKHFKGKKVPSIFYEFFMTKISYDCATVHSLGWVTKTPYTLPVVLGVKIRS